MKCKNIFRARIFSPFQGRYRFSGRGVAVEGFLIRLLTVLWVAIITLPSCQEEEPPAGTNQIEMGTTSASTISYRTATVTSSAEALQGNRIIQHGHVWGTAANPTTDINKTTLGPLTEATTFSGNLENLQPATHYFVRSYLSTEYETIYGTSSNFTTLKTGNPVVITAEPDSITVNSVVCGGETVNDSGLVITEYGLCWDTTEVFTHEDCLGKQTIGEGIETFSKKITGLSDGTAYYIKAYAKNDAGTGYGATKTFTTTGISVPTVTTSAITGITTNFAQGGGNVTSDGNATVTARGIVWSTTPNPTIEDNTGKITGGTGTGSFTSELAELQDGATYYVRAYATNERGTGYGDEVEFTTTEISVPTVTTSVITGITTNSARGGGNVTSDGNATITARGIVWGTSPNPTLENSTGKTTDGAGTGIFTSELTELQDGATYYVRAYATNERGAGYGDEMEFTTTEISVPTVTTSAITGITTNSAQDGGNVTSDGNATVTARGVVWSTSPNPTTDNNLGKTTDGAGTGSFISELTELQDGATYYVRAYATNERGTGYGNEVEFTTAGISVPTVITSAITGITTNSALGGGNVTSDGNATVTARGIVWSTSPNPTFENSKGKTTDGAGTGSFTSELTELQDGAIYYVRAYAVNNKGIEYGDEITFTTVEVTLAEVITADVTEITATSAICGGEVISDGNSLVTARGIVWNSEGNPNLDNFEGKTSDGNSIGQFLSFLTDLEDNTEYFVKSYAVNEKGVNYGQERLFSTKEGFLDIRDNKLYIVIDIGEQKWFAENLAYLPSVSYNESSTIPRYYVPGGGNAITAKNSEYYKNYGVLYNFPAAKTACPEGWHLPSDEEWEELCIFISNQNGSFTKIDDDWNNVGEFLKTKTGWESGGIGNDKYGFSARPGGFYYWSVVPVYDGIGEIGIWWSSDYRFVRSLKFESNVFYRQFGEKSRGFSVRCLKD